MSDFKIRDFSDTDVGYLMGHTYDSLLFIYGGTFIECFKKYVEWCHGNNIAVFCKALDSMGTLPEIMELYENFFRDRLEVLIKCKQSDIIKSDFIDRINCHNGN